MKKTKSCIALICAVIMLMTAFVVVPVTANAEGRYYPKLTYASCQCDKKCSKCMVKKVCKYQGKSACKCKCNITRLASYSTSTSHIWTNKKEAIIKATLTVNGKASTKYVMIGKKDNKYYWNFKTKNKKGHWSFNDSKRKYGKYYLQELFEMNRTTEKKGTLVITLPKTTYYTNGFFRVYGNKTVNGNECTLVKTNDNPVFINFDNTNTNTKAYNGSSNITIKNMSVNCTYNKKHYGEGFMYAAHGSNLNIDNITVENSLYAGHVFQITAMKKVSITNSCFQNLNYLDRNNNYLFGVSYADKQIEDFKKGANNQIANFNKTSKKTMKLVTSSSYFERLNFSNEKSYKHNYQKESYYRKQMKKGKSIKFVDSKEKSNCILTNGILYNHEVIQIEPDYADTDDTTFALPTIKMSNDGTVCDNITISGCKFNKVMRAIGNHSNRCKDKKRNPKQSKNIYIKNNTFEYVVGHGITLINYSNVHIAKNKFQIVSDARIGGSCVYNVATDGLNYKSNSFRKSIKSKIVNVKSL